MAVPLLISFEWCKSMLTLQKFDDQIGMALFRDWRSAVADYFSHADIIHNRLRAMTYLHAGH